VGGIFQATGLEARGGNMTENIADIITQAHAPTGSRPLSLEATVQEDERGRELRRWRELAQALRHAQDAYEEALQAHERALAAHEAVSKAHQDSFRAHSEVRWALGEALRIASEE
jgi:hypothetical protein